MMLWKAILLEKRIIIYSSKSSTISNFIFSILSLLPGALHFHFNTNPIYYYEVINILFILILIKIFIESFKRIWITFKNI